MNEDKIEELLKILNQPIFKAKFPETIPEEWSQYDGLVNLYHGLIQLRNFIKSVAEGDLQAPLEFKGYLAGTMKSLQANLRHMTWQTQMIANGDFSQHLDFLGEFSDAFNSMTMQLEASIRTIKEKENELAEINRGLLQEMKQKKEAQAALAKSEAHYRRLTETMTDIVLILELPMYHVSYISPSLTPLLGWEPHEFTSLQPIEIFTPKSLNLIKKTLFNEQQLFETSSRENDNRHFSLEAEMLHKNGGTIWTEIVAHFDKENEGLQLHTVIRDITERRELRLQLEKQASIDELTGLFNRRYFMDRAKQAVCHSKRYSTPLSFMMLDIDHFKKVNDTFGHGTGDTALQSVATTCKNTLRNTDILGRIGGEEFAAFMPETTTEDALIIAERVRKEVDKITLFSEKKGLLVPLSVSIGVSTLQKEDCLSELMRDTDDLLYHAKGNGRNRVCSRKDLTRTHNIKGEKDE